MQTINGTNDPLKGSVELISWSPSRSSKGYYSYYWYIISFLLFVGMIPARVRNSAQSAAVQIEEP